MLYNVMLIIQILVSLGIIGLVLIQHGKGADAGAAFGGGASGTVFGSKGSGSFLTRLTGILAAVFFANSLMLAWLVAHPEGAEGKSIVPAAISETAPDKLALPTGSSVGATDATATPEVEKKAPADIPK
ncbi:MAG: preprotein translocase subunit SecG [Cocleimonas sp.]